MMHDLVALAPLLEEVDPSLVELLPALIVERVGRVFVGPYEVENSSQYSSPSFVRKVDSCSSNSRSKGRREGRARAPRCPIANGLPAPSGGGGRNGRIIANIERARRPESSTRVRCALPVGSRAQARTRRPGDPARTSRRT